MGFKKCLGTLTRKCHDEHGIGMDQTHHKEYDLLQYAVKLDNGMTKVNLSFAGLLAQGHKYLFAGLFDLTNCILNDGIATCEAFPLQNLPDPLGCMTLLLGNLFVSFYVINIRPDL